MRNAFRIVPTLAFSLLLPLAASGQGAFANPPELVHQKGHLKAVIQLGDADRAVPNGNSRTHLRMFQGWPYVGGASTVIPTPVPPAANVAPGPTLRSRVGGRVDVMFLNKVDDGNFHYTTDTNGSSTSADCDHAGGYPFNDVWPNCFHGSSTSNLHFHGTHTSPDGVGDNVLIQVLPDKNVNQAMWQKDFDAIFNAPHPPQNWSGMPAHYQTTQLGYTALEIMHAAHAGKKLTPKGLVADYDKAELAKAQGAGRPAPESLWLADITQVAAGVWPQYVVGAFPNALELPDYKGGTAGFHAGQAPGTHWYHAHKHGSTSMHILSGLSGVLIIEGDYDDKLRAFFQKQLPASRKLVENVMVFQQIVPAQNLEKTQGTGTGDNPQGGMNQKLINGKINPTISMMPGEIQLWRLVNAMGGGGKGTIDPTFFNSLLSAGFDIKQVAFDGVQFSWDNYLVQPFLSSPSMNGGLGLTPPGLTLAAGNRADILVRAPMTPGISRFTATGDLNNAPGTPFLMLTVNVAVPTSDPIKQMRFFSLNDKKDYPPMPVFLSDLPPPPNAKDPHVVTFSADKGPPNNPPPKFTIDGAQFSLNKDGTVKTTVDQCVRVNSSEDWLLMNTSPASNQAHPFHIHINPFQVIEVTSVDSKGNKSTYRPTGNPVWQDVVNIPPNGGSVLIRQKFNDFLGTYVLHCHILAHEDRGMMQLVRTIPAGADKNKACKLNGLEHH